MATMQERMDDASFGIISPQCKKCKHVIQRKFDNKHPEIPTMECSLIGEIPLKIEINKVTCDLFEPK